MQVLGHDRYTDNQLLIAFSLNYLAEMPCPSALFLTIFHITRIRQQAWADRRTKQQSFTQAVQKIFADIDAFDRQDALANDNSLNKLLKKEMASIIAQLFQVAVRVYAILSLPRAAVLAAHPYNASYQGLRASQRHALGELLRKAQRESKDHYALGWAMMVAGVAAGAAVDEASSDDPGYAYAVTMQRLVDAYFYSSWIETMSTSVELAMVVQLRRYWASGGTEWDECFDEPTPS